MRNVFRNSIQESLSTGAIAERRVFALHSLHHPNPLGWYYGPERASDATGATVWQARYDAFGGIRQVLADTGVLTQNLRFPGQWFQAGEAE